MLLSKILFYFLFSILNSTRIKILFLLLDIKSSLQCLLLVLFSFRQRLSCLPSSSIMSIISGHFVPFCIQAESPECLVNLEIKVVELVIQFKVILTIPSYIIKTVKCRLWYVLNK